MLFFNNTKKRDIKINIIEGNLINVQSDAIILGIYEGKALPAAASTFHRHVVDMNIMEKLHNKEINTSLGAITALPITNSGLNTKKLVFAGLGAFTNRHNPKVLKVAANSAAQYFRLNNITEITTVPIGIGVGLPDETVVKSLFTSFLKQIKKDTTIHTINICDLNKHNCHNIALHCNALLNNKYRNSFKFQINHQEISKEGPEGDIPPIPLQLIINSEESDDTITLKIQFIGANNNAFNDEVSHTKADFYSEISALKSDLINHKPIDDQIVHELFDFFVGSNVAKAVDCEIQNTVRPIKFTLDHKAALIPWEALSVVSRQYMSTSLPISRSFIQDKSIYLSTATKKATPRRFKENRLKLLLAVDPTRFTKNIAPLPKAEPEGLAIEAALSSHEYIDVVSYFPSKDKEITKELLLEELNSNQYDAFHFAGHANFNEHDPSQTGLLCAGGEYLTGADIKSASITTFPPLMFLNACQSVRINHQSVENEFKELEGERGIAEAFLNAGVEHLIGTYWPVLDSAASTFSYHFYRLLLTRHTIGEAIFRARQEVLKKHANEWANYMHFGEPSFRLKVR